jgi:hypothetical protein
MLSMAEFELDRMRANFEAARARRIARGAHYGHGPPIGYLRDSGGYLSVDEHMAPHIREVFAAGPMGRRGGTSARTCADKPSSRAPVATSGTRAVCTPSSETASTAARCAAARIETQTPMNRSSMR